MTLEKVQDALKTVVDPDLGVDIVSLKFIKDLSVAEGRVGFTIEAANPSAAKREALAARARDAVVAVAGPEVQIQTRFLVRSVSAPEHVPMPMTLSSRSTVGMAMTHPRVFFRAAKE